MGTNFHTALVANNGLTATNLNADSSNLDRAITYLKNVIVSGGGVISHVKSTGVLSWSGTIRIKFYTTAGTWVENTIAAGNVTLTDGQAAYVTLNETDATALTVSAGSSGFLAYNVLVLAYRETTSDNVFPVHLHPQLNDPDKIVQTVTCADTVTIDWGAGSTAIITLDRGTTAFTFSGARNGQKLMLVIKQDATGSRLATFGSEVRYGTDLTGAPTLTTTASKKDRLGYVYDGDDSKYDYVAEVKGF